MSSVRLEPVLKEKIERVAKTKGITLSEVHRQALQDYCERELVKPQTSRYDDVIGIYDSRESGGSGNDSVRYKEIFGEGLTAKYTEK